MKTCLPMVPTLIGLNMPSHVIDRLSASSAILTRISIKSIHTSRDGSSRLYVVVDP